MSDKITSRLCRAARALAGWNQTDLARAADVCKQTIVDFERGARTPFRNNLRAIEQAFASASVEFTVDAQGRPGVRLDKALAGAKSPGIPSGLGSRTAATSLTALRGPELPKTTGGGRRVTRDPSIRR